MGLGSDSLSPRGVDLSSGNEPSGHPFTFATVAVEFCRRAILACRFRRPPRVNDRQSLDLLPGRSRPSVILAFPGEKKPALLLSQLSESRVSEGDRGQRRVALSSKVLTLQAQQ